MSCQIYLGDTIEVMDVLPDQSVDMICADLPYGTTACSWDSVIPLPALWAAYYRLIKPAGAIVLTASQPFTSVLIMSNLAGFRHQWVWLKNRGTNPFQANVAPLKKHEDVIVFGREVPNYFPLAREGRGYTGFSSKTSRMGEVYGSRSTHKHNPEGVLRPVTPLVFDIEFGLHPTQKPVGLMEYLILTYTKPGATVLDNTMGSGTTGVACINTSRSFIGIERDPSYFETARNRIHLAELI